MSEDVLRRHHIVWTQKPVLRRLYASWYQEICRWLTPGLTVEVGGGTGNLKEFSPHVLCTDVVKMPWLDVLVDAQHLPFRSRSVSNIVLFDVLHHLENVRYFFDEALRVLVPSGRIVIMDPYVSALSWPIYRFLHPEPMDFRRDPLAIVAPFSQRQPFDANQAVARIVFERSYERFRHLYPNLAKIAHERSGVFRLSTQRRIRSSVAFALMVHRRIAEIRAMVPSSWSPTRVPTARSAGENVMNLTQTPVMPLAQGRVLYCSKLS